MLGYGKLRAALLTALIVGLSGCLMNPAALAQSSHETPKPPVFDAATIKPPAPNAPYRNSGFYGYPGGRVFFGGVVLTGGRRPARSPDHDELAGAAQRREPEGARPA